MQLKLRAHWRHREIAPTIPRHVSIPPQLTMGAWWTRWLGCGGRKQPSTVFTASPKLTLILHQPRLAPKPCPYSTWTKTRCPLFQFSSLSLLLFLSALFSSSITLSFLTCTDRYSYRYSSITLSLLTSTGRYSYRYSSRISSRSHIDYWSCGWRPEKWTIERLVLTRDFDHFTVSGRLNSGRAKYSYTAER